MAMQIISTVLTAEEVEFTFPFSWVVGFATLALSFSFFSSQYIAPSGSVAAFTAAAAALSDCLFVFVAVAAASSSHGSAPHCLTIVGDNGLWWWWWWWWQFRLLISGFWCYCCQREREVMNSLCMLMVGLFGETTLVLWHFPFRLLFFSFQFEWLLLFAVCQFDLLLSYTFDVFHFFLQLLLSMFSFSQKESKKRTKIDTATSCHFWMSLLLRCVCVCVCVWFWMFFPHQKKQLICAPLNWLIEAASCCCCCTDSWLLCLCANIREKAFCTHILPCQLISGFNLALRERELRVMCHVCARHQSTRSTGGGKLSARSRDSESARLLERTFRDADENNSLRIAEHFHLGLLCLLLWRSRAAALLLPPSSWGLHFIRITTLCELILAEHHLNPPRSYCCLCYHHHRH